MAFYKFGYVRGEEPKNCKVNDSSFKQTKIACENVLKILPHFSFVEFLFPSDAELIPFEKTGNFSETAYITSNESSIQALQFGKIDGIIFNSFIITAQRFEHLTFSNSFVEQKFCFAMGTDAVYQSGDTSDSFYWLQPFKAHVWAIFFISFLFGIFFHKKKFFDGKLCEFFVSFYFATFFVFYSSTLKAEFMKTPSILFPYPTLESLSDALSSNKIQIATTMISFLENWISEASNFDRNWNELKISLDYNPIFRINIDNDICEFLVENPNVVVVDLYARLIDNCKLESILKVEMQCKNEFPTFFAALAFPKRSPIVEPIARVTEFLNAMEKISFMRDNWKLMGKSFTNFNSKHKNGLVSLDFQAISVLFAIFFALHFFASFFLFGEKIFFYLAKKKRSNINNLQKIFIFFHFYFVSMQKIYQTVKK